MLCPNTDRMSLLLLACMYNLILLTSSICLVDRYEEAPVLQNVYG